MAEAPRVGVGIIIQRDHKILLLKRKNVHGSGSWSAPGGHLDYGESLEACAVREVKEETGLDLTNVRFRAITNDFFEQESKHYITIWMAGDCPTGEAVINAAYEMSEIGWFALDHLPPPLFLSLQNLLDSKCYPLPSDIDDGSHR
jgi:8-oxo-dGTP diphosphatase